MSPSTRSATESRSTRCTRPRSRPVPRCCTRRAIFPEYHPGYYAGLRPRPRRPQRRGGPPHPGRRLRRLTRRWAQSQCGGRCSRSHCSWWRSSGRSPHPASVSSVVWAGRSVADAGSTGSGATSEVLGAAGVAVSAVPRRKARRRRFPLLSRHGPAPRCAPGTPPLMTRCAPGTPPLMTRRASAARRRPSRPPAG